MGRDRESDNYIDDDLGYTYTYLTKVSDVIESFRLKNVLKSRATVNFHMQDIVMSFEYVCIEQTTQAV